ncbi:MAG TPA: 30S ribosomal protein S13 [Patescibacteria group bacterium]
MARISGVTIPDNKRIEVALTYIFGIGRSQSREILKSVDVDFNIRTKDLSEDQLNKIRDAAAKLPIEGDLRREILLNIRRLKEIGSYRGSRHTRRLPVRGQRTKTNSRSIRGNVRRTMGSGRKPTAQKT